MWRPDMPITTKDLVVRWANAELEARRTERLAASTPRYALARRRGARREARYDRKHATTLRASLPPTALEDVAADLVHQQWRSVAGGTGRNHPFHPALEAQWQQQAPELAAGATAAMLSSDHYGRLPVADVPDLGPLLTDALVRRVLGDTASRVAQVANDADMLDALDEGDGGPVLRVQHRASGLRVSFQILTSDPGFGRVHGKPYKIESIDPDKPGPCHNWSEYAGLGIGTRIYSYAAAVLPDVRWQRNSTSRPAEQVRRKLHRLDPYRWAVSYCEWCEQHGIDWRAAAPTDYAGHTADVPASGDAAIR